MVPPRRSLTVLASVSEPPRMPKKTCLRTGPWRMGGGTFDLHRLRNIPAQGSFSSRSALKVMLASKMSVNKHRLGMGGSYFLGSCRFCPSWRKTLLVTVMPQPSDTIMLVTYSPATFSIAADKRTYSIDFTNLGPSLP